MKRTRSKSMTIEEASDFFDEHDIFDSSAVTEVADGKFDLIRKHYIGVDEELYRKIMKKARKLRKPEDVLIRDWLTEKVG